MRMTAPFTTGNQTRVRSSGIWYQLLRELSFFSSVLEGIPAAQQYTVSSSLEEADKGTLMDVPKSDLEATFVLTSSWKTSKGTPGTPDVYSSFVVFPPLRLLSVPLPLRLLSWYVYLPIIIITRQRHYDFRYFEKL